MSRSRSWKEKNLITIHDSFGRTKIPWHMWLHRAFPSHRIGYFVFPVKISALMTQNAHRVCSAIMYGTRNEDAIGFVRLPWCCLLAAFAADLFCTSPFVSP